MLSLAVPIPSQHFIEPRPMEHRQHQQNSLPSQTLVTSLKLLLGQGGD